MFYMRILRYILFKNIPQQNILFQIHELCQISIIEIIIEYDTLCLQHLKLSSKLFGGFYFINTNIFFLFKDW